VIARRDVLIADQAGIIHDKEAFRSTLPGRYLSDLVFSTSFGTAEYPAVQGMSLPHQGK
jgi:hypothetical protein